MTPDQLDRELVSGEELAEGCQAKLHELADVKLGWSHRIINSFAAQISLNS